MYILNPGKSMATVPDLAGELTTWHDHENLCFDGTKRRRPRHGRGVPERHPDGDAADAPRVAGPAPLRPFAGIETHGGGGSAAPTRTSHVPVSV